MFVCCECTCCRPYLSLSIWIGENLGIFQQTGAAKEKRQLEPTLVIIAPVVGLLGAVLHRATEMTQRMLVGMILISAEKFLIPRVV
jgi:hypothetical protein